MTTPRKEPSWQDAPSTIRIFDADSPPRDQRIRRTPDGLSSEMTVKQFFEAFAKPIFLPERNADAKTIYEYGRSVDYWVEFGCDAPLFRIGDSNASRFSTALWKMPGRRKGETASPFTVRKHIVNIQTILSLAGPRDSRSKSPAIRKAQRLLDEVPYLEKPSIEDEDVDDNFTLDEICLILEATRFLTAPTRLPIDPPRWMHSLVRGIYNVGERRGAIFQVGFDDLLEDDPARYPYGRLRFPRQIRKRKRKANLVPLNRWAREAIEDARRGREAEIAANPGAKIWPLPCTMRRFDRIWQRLLERAEIPAHRRFGLHGLRKAAATELADISPLATQQLMRHSDAKTTNRSYVQRRNLAQSLQQMPQPTGRPKPKPMASQMEIPFPE
jgi:Phage integrase family.